MRRCVRNLVLALAAMMAVGCGDATDDIDDGPPPPPGPVCVCPGFFTRWAGACPKRPTDGSIELRFICPAEYAIFDGQCKAEVDTSNFLALLLDQVEVTIPRTGPNESYPVIFQTMANDPPGGLVTIFGINRATNQRFDIAEVLVSNNCP
jgi:hypothetical protein